MTRVARLAYWTIPSLLCLWLYWYGLKTWFLQDDFAWLGLRLSIFTPSDFWKTLFAPMAQGTIRPLSERGFFLLFEYLFGLDALPYRIWVFATQFANLALLSLIVRRLTGSAIAGFLAPVLWAVNSSLSTAMSWTSTYNQILCAFFLLLSFWLFVRFTDTGRKQYYVAQWITFLLGFGALEVMVVYPALALVYAACCARKYAKYTLPLFVLSAIYAVIHRAVSPPRTDEVYRMFWDLQIITTLWTYVRWVVGPERLELFPWGTEQLRAGMFVFLFVGLVGFLVWKLWKRQWLAAFFVCWFLVPLAPLLPLKNHVSEYYLTIPAIGIAMLGAWAMADALGGPWVWKIVAAVALVMYVASNAAVALLGTHFNFERSRWARTLTLGVKRVVEIHPGKMIVLLGVTEDSFWAGVADNPFRLFGAQDVYLAPESQVGIEHLLRDPGYSRFALPEAALRKALDRDLAVVYQLERDRLRNVTSNYQAQLARKPIQLSSYIRGGQKVFDDQFGPEWYSIEQGFRWMPKSASVRIGNPGSPGETLAVRGWVPEDVVARRPEFRISVDGLTLIRQVLDTPGGFQATAKIPENLLSQKQLLLRLECSETFSPPGDGRPLCAAFGEFAIR